ncbi:fumarylacetoacetate hydrolase family protein [Lichenihabitans sp. Uapishka_5]|uniref:fumarylacetoacetate hydrolase family protein n=1 Tax=Lichenihabitans sp. Uapishka_5 TaxID=3037302 RepID=UPI0029E80B38|nr:fumarylacetoacetate hydrolase family protein [Lichenihabitans sp. Uapishka_5]MDX7950896.1 fumarylacetoacetate hydrolase family protein [Lichenihabitans sp. Uapishka_5]
MKLLRYGEVGHEKPGLLDPQGTIRDLSQVLTGDLGGDNLGPATLDRLRNLAVDTLPKVDGSPRIGACVARPCNFIAVGLNYADHAAESNMPIPKEPILFNKAPNCIVGPYDAVMLPRGSEKSDWEVELAIVIGSRTSYITEAEVPAHVAGYCICNDVSEREYQIERGGQWMKGKGCATFGPLGPWLVTADEIADVGQLGMWLDVNEQRCQTGTTGTMIFDVKKIVSYLSHFMVLEAGDVITTGTPPGVGMGMKPPRFLKPGDTMALGIDGLGAQKQSVVAWSKAAA